MVIRLQKIDIHCFTDDFNRIFGLKYQSIYNLKSSFVYSSSRDGVRFMKNFSFDTIFATSNGNHKNNYRDSLIVTVNCIGFIGKSVINWKLHFD